MVKWKRQAALLCLAACLAGGGAFAPPRQAQSAAPALPCAVGAVFAAQQSPLTHRFLEAGGTRLPLSHREAYVPLSPGKKAARWLSALSPAQKVGQLLLVRFPLSGAQELAQEVQPGGYLLFARDVARQTPDSLRELLESCQSGVLVPMLTGVDEEGGTVVRISAFAQYRESPFPSPRELMEGGGSEAAARDAGEKAALLLSLGINLNLGPVCDIADDPKAFLYARSAGDNAGVVSEFVRAVVTASRQQGLGCVLKHFPGYGNNADTHVGEAVDRRPLEAFESRDFLPFEAGIEAGAGAVMVSHNTMCCVDETLPASLSPAVHALLRGELGFDGVVVSDDLDMAAVAQGADQGELAVAALLAGNDLLCTGSPLEASQALLRALDEGRLSPERLDQSVFRILLWKASLGLLP